MLNSVIDCFATGIYPVSRAAQGAYDANGFFVEASSSIINVSAAIQPVSGSDLRVLPEGRHADNTRKVYCKVELFTESPTNAPDIFILNGENWEVFSVYSYEGFGAGNGADYYKVMIARQGTP